jgi:DnaJ-class molecular chaperone
MPETLTTEKPLRIPNKGYKYQDGNGHFYIKLVMEKTKNLDSQQKEKLKSILE